MQNVLLYTAVTSFLRKNLFRKKETASRIRHSRAMTLLKNPNTFIAKMQLYFQSLSKGAWVPPMMQDSSKQNGFFSSLDHRWCTRRENPYRSCPLDCVRKPKKVSSSSNHRWFYSYGKPLKFLSRKFKRCKSNKK